MKIKFKKYVYKSFAEIFVDRIDCTAKNILQFISVFNFNNILAIIDCEDDLSAFNLELEQNRIKYTTSFTSNTNVILLSDEDNFKKIITDAFKYKPESILLINVNDQSLWEQYLYNINYLNGRKLVRNNYSELCINAAIDEFEISITLNTHVYDASAIASKIKELF